MPDHLHLIVNPRDGRIRKLMGKLKSQSARSIIAALPDWSFDVGRDASGRPLHQVWQESFKALPLWSDWMIWQKINYIHNNPVRAGLVTSAGEYRWSSFGAFYSSEANSAQIDRDWWWPDDVRKLSVAAAEWSKEMEATARQKKEEAKSPQRAKKG